MRFLAFIDGKFAYTRIFRYVVENVSLSKICLYQS
jgi:hypothetical protein